MVSLRSGNRVPLVKPFADLAFFGLSFHSDSDIWLVKKPDRLALETA